MHDINENSSESSKDSIKTDLVDSDGNLVTFYEVQARKVVESDFCESFPYAEFELVCRLKILK
jgi:hypothetical protein